MSQLTIAESDNLVSLANNSGQAMMLPPKAEQVLAISGAPAQSQPFGAGWSTPLPANRQILFIRVNTDTACCIVAGDPAGNPTAATTNMRLAANQTEYFGVHQGDVLSVIQTT